MGCQDVTVASCRAAQRVQHRWELQGKDSKFYILDSKRPLGLLLPEGFHHGNV